MEQPLVSIVIPVYNAAPDLARCIESVRKQTYRNIEVFLVNDGSKDASSPICHMYERIDPRVHVIDKENAGVSAARNTGIAAAQGKYIQFVDSDDYLAPGATATLIERAEHAGADMVIAHYYRVDGGKTTRHGFLKRRDVMDQREFARELMDEPASFYYGVLWNKLYRRDLVNRFGIRMDAEISWCEDFMFNLEYVRYAETFYALRTPVYYYVKTKGSLVNQKISITKTVKMKLMMFEYYNNFYKHVLDEEDYEKNRLQVYHFLVDAAKDGFVFPASIPGNRKLGEERSSALQEVISDDGIIVDKYRDRKLLERYLESAALKHDMTMEELSLLLYLKDARHELSRKNLADLMDLSRGDLAVAVQRLSAKKMVEVTELPRRRGTERKIRLELLPASEAVIPDLEAAENDYYQAKFGNFTEEEIRQYTLLARKVRENEMSILQRG